MDLFDAHGRNRGGIAYWLKAIILSKPRHAYLKAHTSLISPKETVRQGGVVSG